MRKCPADAIIGEKNSLIRSLRSSVQNAECVLKIAASKQSVLFKFCLGDKMVELTINNIKVKAEEGMTILEAAKSVGIYIPTLCHMKDLFPSGACRICVVEVDGMRGLTPSCAYPVGKGMKIETNSARVRIARKTIIELLIENHPQDCLICVRNRNCELQDYQRSIALENTAMLVKRKITQLIFQVHQWSEIPQNVFYAADVFEFAERFKK